MATNRITLQITECGDATGYIIYYRPQGTSGPYRQSSLLPPGTTLTWDDNTDPANTEYEGFIVSACPSGNSNPVNFITGGEVTWEAINGSCITIPTCSEGYTLSADELQCIRETETEPIEGQELVAKNNSVYGVCGSYIYSSFALNGTGTSSRINPANSFWTNGTSGTCSVATGSTSLSPLNRCGLWLPGTETDNQECSFSFNINVTVAKTYYFGMGADNIGRLNIDGSTIINQSPSALDAQYGTSGGASTYRVWHIYPYYLEIGTHLIELVGINGVSPGVNPASIGAEVYDATAAELIAATSYADLGAKLIFSTKDYIGQPSCAPGYSLRFEGGVYSCVMIETASPTPVRTGEKEWEDRRRLANGVPDGYQEPNLEGVGIGPYFPPEETEDCAP